MYNLGPYSRKLFPKMGFEVVLLHVVDIFYENLKAFTQTDITLSEACRKYFVKSERVHLHRKS